MEKGDSLSVALWATHLGSPLAGLGDWLSLVAANMQRAADAGAHVLVMPEYAAEHWLAFAPRGIALHEEIPWLASLAGEALAGLAPLPARFGVGLLAGTMPISVADGRDDGPPVVNRAHLLLPDGRVIEQDKLCLTPVEKNPEGWHLSSGHRISIVRWRGLRLAILVCLDIELPALAARLAAHDVDIVLVPSMTETLAGYNRVFSCARARATELLAAVGAVGCIGAVAMDPPRRPCVSGAAMYLPSDTAIGPDGIATLLPPVDGCADSGPLVVTPELPIARLRELRRGGAEVWPGAWQDTHVSIVEA